MLAIQNPGAFSLDSNSEWADNPYNAVNGWHSDMANALHALDPYDHLVTTSLARGSINAIWSLPEMDLVQLHHYAFPLAYASRARSRSGCAPLRTPYPGKPLLVGEYGTDYRGPAETLEVDPDSVGFHQGCRGPIRPRSRARRSRSRISRTAPGRRAGSTPTRAPTWRSKRCR